MDYRTLASTGLAVSRVAFGAGPVAQLLVGEERQQQRDAIGKALELGVNWFDTAATYADGQSELHLGRELAEQSAGDRVHVATKVRLLPQHAAAPRLHVRQSVQESLRRLRLERITLLQIHNAITCQPDAQPTSITPAQVLAPGGVLEELDQLRREGLVLHLGLSGLGEPAALDEVIETGHFATIQVPFNLLNPSAGQVVGGEFAETNYGNLIARCGRLGLGVFVIRVLAGGALAGHAPSPHTLQTRFFPLDLYQRDLARAERLTALLPPGLSREEVAVRFALGHPQVDSAIIGFAGARQIEQTLAYAAAGPLEPDLIERLLQHSLHTAPPCPANP